MSESESKTASNNRPGPRWRRGFTVIGHRGAKGLVAENTLASFRHAVALGSRAVELDVYLHEGELIVLHDNTLNRTTNGKGPLQRHSLAALRALDAGNGGQIPLLSEVFAALPARIAINIELKGPTTGIAVASALNQWQPKHPVLVSSFDHRELASFRAAQPETALAPLFHKPDPDMLDIGRRLNACAINLSTRLATRARLEQIRGAGFGALIYTVNNLRSARRLARDGATGLFTDRPDRLTEHSIIPNP